MLRIEFRVKSRHSLLAIDLPMIEKHLSALQPVKQVELFDDRASDATFITIVVTLADETSTTLAAVRQALLQFSDLIPCIVDEHGEETLVASIGAEEMKKYARDNPS